VQRAVLCLVLAGGCISPTSRPRFEEPPLPALKLEVSTVPPPDGDGKIVRDALLRVSFDDYPDPDTAQFGPLLLRSGNATFDVLMRVDLTGRAITVQPRSLLAPDTQYELVLGAELRALSGRTLGQTQVAALSVGSGLNPSPSPSPTPVTFETDVYPLLSSCAPYCHTRDRCPGRTPPNRNPSRDLDLAGDPTDPKLGLIDVPAVSLRDTDNPLRRVQPFDSARSVLLRKILGGDPHANSSDPITPDLAVPGRRMPLYESVCGEELPPPELFFWDEARTRLNQDWIDQGAH
jgi:hypothetical protein